MVMKGQIRNITHKYAIDSTLLGDDALLAWSNLGYWQGEQSYPLACQTLAERLAQAIKLQATDHLLDLGCGRGASLLYWLEHYQIQYLSAVDVQPDCIERIQNNLPQVDSVCRPFLKLTEHFAEQSFDAILCIDAAYHSDLQNLLQAMSSLLRPHGRVAFHTLAWSEKGAKINKLQRFKYQTILRAADVSLNNLHPLPQLASIIESYAFHKVEIRDISQPVLDGFATYHASLQRQSNVLLNLDQLKIDMTAKLCRKLYRDGFVHYVEIVAVKK